MYKSISPQSKIQKIRRIVYIFIIVGGLFNIFFPVIAHADIFNNEVQDDSRVGQKTREKHNNRLYDVRVKMNISQRKLAEMSGLTRNTIMRIENEDVQPSLDSCRKICAALGVTVTEVFDV